MRPGTCELACSLIIYLEIRILNIFRRIFAVLRLIEILAIYSFFTVKGFQENTLQFLLYNIFYGLLKKIQSIETDTWIRREQSLMIIRNSISLLVGRPLKGQCMPI